MDHFVVDRRPGVHDEHALGTVASVVDPSGRRRGQAIGAKGVRSLIVEGERKLQVRMHEGGWCAREWS